MTRFARTTAASLASTVLGMAGIRLALRHKPILLLASVAAWTVITAWVFAAFRPGQSSPRLQALAVALAAVAWLVYYVGNTLVLGSGINRWLIRRLGEGRALDAYNAVMAVTFGLQAAVHGAVNAAFAGTMGVPSPRIWITCGFLVMGFGLVVKVWATRVTSMGTYYYNDMFLGRPLVACPEYVERGPYRLFRNPMYGVGNLSAYGAALMALSWQGLVLAAVFQASIFAFHWLVERPFVMRVYIRR